MRRRISQRDKEYFVRRINAHLAGGDPVHESLLNIETLIKAATAAHLENRNPRTKLKEVVRQAQELLTALSAKQPE